MINKSKMSILWIVLLSVTLNGQMINRYGTTTANFLEIGGEAYTLGQAALELCLLYTSPSPRDS